MRIARLTPDVLDTDQQALYAEIAGGPRANGPQLFQLTGDDGALEGPFNAFLLQPHIGRALQSVGAAVRYRTTLSARARELAILVVAVRWKSQFEWYAHEAVGRHVGLTNAELEAVQSRDYICLTDATEHIVATTADHLSWAADLDDQQYATARSALGEAQLFELITLVGYYAALALQLRTFRVSAPDEQACGSVGTASPA
jgi:4-carboxymuconolactone decarboxylase